jgi:hypothetical protein
MHDRNIEILREEYASIYQQGIDCESSGNGREAFEYYRKIVKENFDEMLDNTIQILRSSSEEISQYLTAIERVKNIKLVRDKITAIESILPASLIPTNLHPLAALHYTLSEGLERRSDDECLQAAPECRKRLISLVDEVLASRDSHHKFTEMMCKLNKLKNE